MASIYQSAVEALYALGAELASPQPKRFDLGNMRVLTRSLGEPQTKFKSVLVAGTNGKGSTCATLASILHASGYRTGLYTSPHLVRVNERIRIDGAQISDADFGGLYERVQRCGSELLAKNEVTELPSFFETLTGMAFLHFAEQNVDIAILEVGMGGRLDATNIAEPLLSVITDVSLDHQNYLGNTIAEIAREKAGIIKQSGVLVTLPQHPQANDVIGQVATERNARGVSATRYMPNVSPGAVKFDELRPMPKQMGAFLMSRYMVEVMDEELLVETPLLGRHQVRNIALATTAAVELAGMGFKKITPQAMADGVRNTRWPGRFQLIVGEAGSPDFLLDVAHNPDGAWSLRSGISTYFEELKVTLIFGGMRDKALGEMAEILFPIAGNVILTQAHTPRAASAPDLLSMAERTGADAVMSQSVAEAIALARTITPANGVIVVTGSIYVVGEALALLQPELKHG